MLDYLRIYDKNVNIIDIKDIDSNLIPKYWLKALSKEFKKDTIKEILNYWKLYFSLELSNSINLLESNLQDVLLLESEGKYSLLYCIKSLEDEIIYYQGLNPMDFNANSDVLNKISLTLSNLGQFYKRLHNGFFHYSSHAMGLLPEEEIVHFKDYDWGILEELEEPLRIELDTTYGVFSSGSGGYVAIDISTKKCTVWFSDDTPEYGIKFWDVVDEWIQIGLEG